VLVIADPHLSVPPLNYGGTERVVHFLCDGLRKEGLKVDLVAKRGSLEYGGRLFCHVAPTKRYFSRVYRKFIFQLLLFRLLVFHKYDCIINNGRVDYLFFALLFTKIPIINVFHNPIAEYELKFLKKRTEKIEIVGISKNHLKEVGLPNVSVAYNSVDFADKEFNKHSTRGYLFFLGRLTKNKGVDKAIEIARKADVPLVIAGNISKEPGGLEFYYKRVEPYLSETITYVGEVDDGEKKKYFSGAIATLFPICWDEPFGLVMIESLAYGVPVIAMDKGAVREIVCHEKTGFICNSLDEMVTAVGRVNEIDREACHNDVKRRFSQDMMVASYLSIIKSLLF